MTPKSSDARHVFQFAWLLILCCGHALPAHATQCWVFRVAPAELQWPVFSTGAEFCEYARNYQEVNRTPNPNYTYTQILASCTYLGTPINGNNPATGVWTSSYPLVNGCDFRGQNCVTNAPGGWHHDSAYVYPYACEGFFVSAGQSKQSEIGGSCKTGKPSVADPIVPSTGAVVRTEGDCAASSGGPHLSYGRFYDSNDDSASSLGIGWRGQFSRSVAANSVTATFSLHVATNPDHSQIHPTEAAACEAGFAQIQSRVASWANATASFQNNLCRVIKAGAVIAVLPVHSSKGVPMPTPTPISYDVTRDDGQLIRFWNQSGSWVSSSGVTMRFQQTAAGFELRDSNDNVETYDSNGRLLSITSRAGVAQTMGYDTNGRLSTVTDSFGHRLVFGYDTQNRLTSVTRE